MAQIQKLIKKQGNKGRRIPAWQRRVRKEIRGFRKKGYTWDRAVEAAFAVERSRRKTK